MVIGASAAQRWDRAQRRPDIRRASDWRGPEPANGNERCPRLTFTAFSDQKKVSIERLLNQRQKISTASAYADAVVTQHNETHFMNDCKPIQNLHTG